MPALIALLVWMTGALAAGPVAADAAIRALAASLRQTGPEVELRLSFDRAPAHSAAVLADPWRLVIDLPLIAWRLAPPAPPGLRWGLAAPGASRAALPLAGPMRIAAQRLEPEGDGVALVLTLAPGAPEQPSAGAPIRPTPERSPVIALDAGHGGADPGAARGGLVEKDVTLAFAQVLAARLRAAGFGVALTRAGDETVGLSQRLARARAAGADALVSLHADAAPQPGVAGASVYTLSATASDALAAALAQGQDAAALVGGGAFDGAESDLAPALSALARPAAAAASRALAAALLAALAPRTPTLPGNPLRAAGFRVLAAPDFPAVLIELGFLSNAQDRARLSDPAWRDMAAEAVAQGVLAWWAQR